MRSVFGTKWQIGLAGIVFGWLLCFLARGLLANFGWIYRGQFCDCVGHSNTSGTQ
jgi:hypothetical protein